MGALAARLLPGVERPESGGVSNPPLKQTADSDFPRGNDSNPRPKESAMAGSNDRRSTFENDQRSGLLSAATCELDLDKQRGSFQLPEGMDMPLGSSEKAVF